MTSFKLVVIASAVSALAFIPAMPAQAHAVAEGQCLPRDQMIGRMHAEGQRVVVTAVAVTDASVQPLPAHIAYSYSANSSGGEGYELITEQGGAVLCVRQHLTNIRIADPSRQQVSPFYMARSVSDAAAREIGRREGASYVGHDAILDESAARGLHPMFYARTGGSGVLFIVARPEQQTSFIFQGTARGVMGIRHFMHNTGLTDYGTGLVSTQAIWPD
jgi:hypothetical protein